MNKTLIAVLFTCSTIIYSQDFLPTHNGELVRHSKFILSYIEKYEQSEWVHYKLSPNDLEAVVRRTNNFKIDPKVSTSTANNLDYKYSGYDRGHLVPAGDMVGSVASMNESFYYSNISPQNTSFNRGGWKKLETLVRNWAKSSPLIITTGSVLKDDLKEIGASKVKVPNYYYKIIYNPINQKAIAFFMPNKSILYSLESYVVNINYVESKTGIDFLSELDDNIEEKIESSKDLDNWDFSNTSVVRSNANSKSTAKKCIGIAESTGVQCKNRTKNKNNYCYIHQNQSLNHKPKPKNNYSGRCNAITQKGTQCKRNASSGTKYCWQHQ